jgi:hypothetical protein
MPDRLKPNGAKERQWFAGLRSQPLGSVARAFDKPRMQFFCVGD